MLTEDPAIPHPELGIEVPLAELGHRLKLLWQSSEAKTKASLMNFAVYSETPGSLADNSNMIPGVLREHACRALLIEADPTVTEVSVRAWITAHCQLTAGGRKAVCSEQLAFLISGQSLNLVPNTVFSWLESDLPLTFWWQGEFSARWEPHLYAVIDRLVIDSGSWPDPLPQLEQLEQAWLHDHGRFTVNDLSWTRVLHLRAAISAAFDETGTHEHLASLEEIRIEYGTGHKLAGRMLAAWIIHQTGWKLEPTGVAPEERILTENGRRIRLTFRSTESTRAVPGLELTGPRGSIVLTHESSSAYIQTRITLDNGIAVERLTPCPCGTPAELVTERLRRGCNTPRYFALLGIVRALFSNPEG